MEELERSDLILKPSPSLRRNSLARFISNAARVIFGFLTAVVTSRLLGPEGKGTLSTLLLLGVLLSYGCSLGLGSAAVFLVKQKRADVSEAVSASLAPALLASLAGVGALWAMAWIADWDGIRGAVLLASLLLPIATLSYLLASFEETAERLVVTSAVSAISAVVTALGSVTFIALLDLGIMGGVLAAVVATTVSAIALFLTLRSQGVHAGLRFSLGYLRRALPYGLVVEGSYLLVAITSRADLLVVYAILGEREAGLFAVALTLGELVTYAPDALSAAAFPRLAGLSTAEVRVLAPRVFRVAVASSMCAAVVLTLGIPLIVKFAFGDRFMEAIGPALILAWGGVFWSGQWILGQIAAARGLTGIYFVCFAASASLMVALDALLLTRVGILGAALIATASSVFGLWLAALLLRNRLGFPLTFRVLWPGFDDFRELMTVLGVSQPRRQSGNASEAQQISEDE